ncbi:MAG: helix-turn-helix domain-containing protein, partial [Fimbriimonadales bacterium]
RVVPRERLFEQVWGYSIEFSSNTLDVYMYRLRKKSALHCLTRVGYRRLTSGGNAVVMRSACIAAAFLPTTAEMRKVQFAR